MLAAYTRRLHSQLRQRTHTRASTPQLTMSSSAATYLVLITAGLSVTYLSFMMYSAYGVGALKAAAPFIGSLSVVFGECASQLSCTSTAEYRLLGEGALAWLG